MGMYRVARQAGCRASNSSAARWGLRPAPATRCEVPAATTGNAQRDRANRHRVSCATSARSVAGKSHCRNKVKTTISNPSGPRWPGFESALSRPGGRAGRFSSGQHRFTDDSIEGAGTDAGSHERTVLQGCNDPSRRQPASGRTAPCGSPGRDSGGQATQRVRTGGGCGASVGSVRDGGGAWIVSGALYRLCDVEAPYEVDALARVLEDVFHRPVPLNRQLSQRAAPQRSSPAIKQGLRAKLARARRSTVHQLQQRRPTEAWRSRHSTRQCLGMQMPQRTQAARQAQGARLRRRHPSPSTLR